MLICWCILTGLVNAICVMYAIAKSDGSKLFSKNTRKVDLQELLLFTLLGPVGLLLWVIMCYVRLTA